jgi:hypothetical protein
MLPLPSFIKLRGWSLEYFMKPNVAAQTAENQAISFILQSAEESISGTV